MSDNILIYKRDRTIYLLKSVVPILSKVVEEYICFVTLAIDSFICELTCISHTRPTSILIFVPLLVKSCIQLFYSTFFTRLSTDQDCLYYHFKTSFCNTIVHI